MKKLSPEQQLALIDAAKVALLDLIGLAGAASVIAGVGMIYRPAALIVGGSAAVAWAFLTARKAN
jgi:hypothetical protein